MLFPPAGCTTIGSLVLFARSAASFAAFLVLNFFLLAIGRLLSFPADNTVLSLDRRHIFGSKMGSALQWTRHWYPVWTLPYPSNQVLVSYHYLIAAVNQTGDISEVIIQIEVIRLSIYSQHEWLSLRIIYIIRVPCTASPFGEHITLRQN